MDYYLNTAGTFLGTPPDNLYELTGTTLSTPDNSEFVKTYSHSDFLRTFDIVNDFYGQDVTTKKYWLWLRK